MVLEFLGAALLTAAWIFEMQRNLRKPEKDYSRYLLVYFIAFLVLATYSVEIKSLVFEFLFAIIALLTLLEFAFIMSKH